MKFNFIQVVSIISVLCCTQSIAQEKGPVEIEQAQKSQSKGEQILFRNKDSAFHYFENAYEIYKEHQDWVHAVNALQNISATSSIHFDLSRYKASITRADSLLKAKKEYFDNPEYRSVKNAYLNLQTDYYSMIKDFQKSREYAEKLRNQIEDIPEDQWTKNDIRYLVTAYEFEAASYSDEGKYQLALDLYEKSLRISLKELDEDFVSSTYRLMGDLYTRLQDYKKSNEYLKKELTKVLGKGSSAKNKIVKSCYVIAQNYGRLQKIDSAKFYLSLAKRRLQSSDPMYYEYYQILGEVYQKEGNMDRALVAMDSALILIKSSNLGDYRMENARLYARRALMYHQNNDYDLALSDYQSSLKKLAADSTVALGVWGNPSPKQIQNKVEFLEVLKDKAITIKEMGNNKATLLTTQLAIEVLDSLKPSFQNEGDKQLLIENAYDLFETGLAVTYNQYLKDKNPNHLKQAFFYIEKGKSTVLLEALLNAKAYRFSNIPVSLLEEEGRLKSTIKNLERQIAVKDNAKVKEELFENRKKYQKLIKSFEDNYPSYYNLKYNQEVISLDELQGSMNSKQIMVSYFFGKGALYAMGITKEKVDFLKIAKDNLENELSVFKIALADRSSQISDFQKTGHSIYQKILQPFVEGQRYDRITIMADGPLHYIPFESLYNGSEYLVENTAFGYINSATLLHQLQTGTVANHQVLAFAPDFSTQSKNSSINFAPLPNSAEEVRHIANYFGGKTYFGNQATLKHFRENLKDYGIIHLATHAQTNDENPEYSFLAFTPQENEENLIYVNDLYAIRLNADLVTLSACDTGLGTFQKGEGLISLSRAFFYSGARSIVNTLWKINDNSSSEIMVTFYENLSKGMYKDEALRQAQLSFLQKHRENKFSHPYYWSSFVVSGNVDPIVEENNLWIYLLLGVLLLTSVIAVVHKIRKRN